MPVATPDAVRQQVSQGSPDPVYLIVGDDESTMTGLAVALSGIVEDELSAFNVERIYASDKSGTPAAIVDAARLLPMMSSRRVVIVVRAEKILKPKRRGKSDEPDDDSDDSAAVEVEVLDQYVREPEAATVLVLVALDVDRTRKLYKTLQKHATIVECWGLKESRDQADLHHAARLAGTLVEKAVAETGQTIEPRASKLVAERAGADIGRLRGDIERLLLYTAGKPRITLEDAREVVSPETAQDDWAVTSAIKRGDTAGALRHLALALESGAVPYMVLGQLAWFVRDRLADVDPRRVPPSIDAVFRTDLDLKSSGGDPRVLLERLVVELCRAG